MTLPRFVLLPALALLSACDPGPDAATAKDERRRDSDRQADEARIAELRALEQSAAERAAAQRAAELDTVGQRLAAERQALESDREKLTEAQRRDAEKRIAEFGEEERRAGQRRAEEEAATARAAAGRRGSEPVEESRGLDFFYGALQPLGDWIELEPYGYAWRPRQATDPRWRPYTDGQWAWTDHGWTWAANEPFGWATYHYGRWTRTKRTGWVWVPGAEWAPAWVAWRRGNEYVGWAPLPPDAHSGSGFTPAVDSYYDIGPSHYTFVPKQAFGEKTYVGRVVDPEGNSRILDRTTNVTNISYRRVKGQTVVFNEGPELEELERFSQQPIGQYQIERVTTVSAQPARAEARQGGILEMVAPLIATAVKPAARPARVTGRAQAAEIQRGWEEAGEPQSVQKVRAQLAQEARTAEDAQRRGQPLRPAAVPVPARAPQTTPAAGEPARPKPRRDIPAATPPVAITPRPAPAPAPAPATPEPVAKATPKPARPSQPPTRKATPKPVATPADSAAARRQAPSSPTPPAPVPTTTAPRSSIPAPKATPPGKPSSLPASTPGKPPRGDERGAARRNPRDQAPPATPAPAPPPVAPAPPATPAPAR